MVSDEDYERVSAFKWCAEKVGYTNYAVRSSSRNPGPRHPILMHRFILSAPDGFVVDHRDKNGLNNQRENMRICTTAENVRNRKRLRNNTSGYKGVCWNKQGLNWQAMIWVDLKSIRLGYFDDPIEAAHAYDKAALKYYGDFAQPNFSDIAEARRLLERTLSLGTPEQENKQ
jgi:hypothetical protein